MKVISSSLKLIPARAVVRDGRTVRESESSYIILYYIQYYTLNSLTPSE